MTYGRHTGGNLWPKGKSGNPNGRPKQNVNVKELAKKHTEDAMKVLVDVATNEKSPPSARVQAAQILLDRGWGKATQYVEAKVGPLDELSIDDKRHLLEALTALSGGEGDAEEGAGSRAH